MLQVTVKTLDSQSRNYSVQDNITVRAFKDHISGSVGIPVERQRLIFQGRVLQDDALLNASGEINGKVLHLVERLPTPSQPTQRPPNNPTSQRNAPFNIAGPAGNISGQLVQQMLQQALSGAGPAVVRGSVRHPNAPGGDARTEIQIHIEGQTSSQSQSPASNTRPRTLISSERDPSHRTGPESLPQHHLANIEGQIRLVQSHVESLEKRDYGPALAASTGESAPSTSAPTTSQAATSTQTNSSQATSSQAPTNYRHPRITEVGKLVRRGAELEARFLPFLNEYADFLEKDAPFESKESPEFKRMTAFATLIMKTQRLIGHMHRLFSMIVIPMSETPPRSMLIQQRPDRVRNRSTVPSNARPIHTTASAGAFLPHEMPRVHQHVHRPPARVLQGQVRFPLLVGPIGGPPGAVPMVGVPTGAINYNAPVRPHQSGLYGHPPPSTSTQPTPAPTQSTIRPRQPGPALSSATGCQIHVTANVEPHININVALPPAAPVEEDIFDNEPTASDSTQAAVAEAALPQIPNIPGVPQEQMSEIVDIIRSSVQRVGVGGRTSVHQSESVELQGGLNVPMEVAQIIGDTVQGIVLEQLHSDQENRTASSQVQTPATESTTTTTTTATTNSQSTPQQASSNPLMGLMDQLTGGSFGNIAEAMTSSSGARGREEGGLIEGVCGRNGRKLPELRRTVNCVNDLVRGRGYPREAMELTGHETILSTVMFLCGELLTMSDCMSFVAGSVQVAERLREPLRRVISECWFDGREPDRDQIEAEVELHSTEARPNLEQLFEGESPKCRDVSVVESNLSLYRFVLRRLLQLLFIHDAERFKREILSHMMDSYALALNLNVHILQGTEQTVSRLVSNYLGAAIGAFGAGWDGDDPMSRQMQEFITSGMIPFARSRPISQDQIDQCVMNVTQPEVQVQTPEEPSEAEESQPVADVSMEEDSASGDAESDWRLTVPGNWVPVMEADIEKQKKISEQPLSEAYLSGTPANKRRKT